MENFVGSPRVLFQCCYFLAFLLIFCVVLYKSIKRGYHLRSVLLMMTTISLFTVLGSRLFTVPVEDWITAINSHSQNFNNRSAIGGLFFGFLGLLVSQRIFGFGRFILNLYAWICPIALGIIKLGCFFNGCCYGIPSNGMWSVQYTKGTHAHFNHWSAGQIAPEALASLSVHPVQLYESVLLVLIGYLVWKTHKKWQKALSALLFGLSLFFMMRFGIEFFRDPTGSQFSTLYYAGLRSYQWSMLAYGMIAGSVLWFYESYKGSDWLRGRENSPFLHADFMYIVVISVCLYSFRNLFSTYELLVIWVKFFPAIVLSVYYLYTENRLKPYRMAISVVLVMPLFVFAQTIPTHKTAIKTYHRVDVGGSFGDFANTVRYNPQQGDCGTVYDSEDYRQTYNVGGLGYSYIKEKNNKSLRLGANVHGGMVKSTNLTNNNTEKDFVFGVNPFVTYDGKWLGGGVGFQLGSLRVNKHQFYDATNIEDAQKEYVFLPEVHARFGPKKYVDIDYNYGFLFPSPYPTIYHRSSIGSSFGLSPDYSLRYGYIWNLETSYLSLETLITKNMGVRLMYIFKEHYREHNTGPGLLEDEVGGKFLFSVNYRFGESIGQAKAKD
ncbi:prolipoprotein diacylglyceryl transferase family protein [Mangrovimonas xylaniphaga]|uniref:prolipoprotein diacylglyceryl transferase family protein n=1 Tax=Mangrovimonas xylaniphaga TaxID=1645915 RepID=UPI0009E92447|nr:prolipoprotein diacylglyceryl transferase family protein [Mangrovimonas xylaniphaga]